MTVSGSTLSPAAADAAELVRHHPKDEVLPELLVKKLGIERWQAVTLLKELADAGYGSFVLGRRGGQTRLEKAESLPVLNLPVAQSTDAGGSDGTYQVFVLRRSPPVHVRVPIDLTVDEADRLGKWLLLVANDGH